MTPIEQIKANENRMAMLREQMRERQRQVLARIVELEQTLQARRVNEYLASEPADLLRQEQRRNYWLKRLMAERARSESVACDIPPTLPEPAAKSVPESEIYLADYSKRLQQAEMANREREQRAAEENQMACYLWLFQNVITLE